MHGRNRTSTESTGAGALVPESLHVSAALCRDALTPLLNADWERPADGLEWPCRRTVPRRPMTTAAYRPMRCNAPSAMRAPWSRSTIASPASTAASRSAADGRRRIRGRCDGLAGSHRTALTSGAARPSL